MSARTRIKEMRDEIGVVRTVAIFAMLAALVVMGAFIAWMALMILIDIMRVPIGEQKTGIVVALAILIGWLVRR